MHDALRRLVLIPSGTYNKPGVDAVCREVYGLLEGLPLERRILPQEQYGDMLIASVPPAERSPRILLVGHMDTIFPAESAFRGWREDERNFYGPGVIDMKGGIVAGIFALKALAALGLLKDLPVTWIFNSEEEIGSPVSQALFTTEAKRSAMAFVLEPGGSRGEVTTGRKGRLGLEIFARGVAGHAAQVVEGKKSAILDIAQVIIDLEGFNGTYPGVSVNVGQTAGGITPNSVPDAGLGDNRCPLPERGGLRVLPLPAGRTPRAAQEGGDGTRGSRRSRRCRSWRPRKQTRPCLPLSPRRPAGWRSPWWSSFAPGPRTRTSSRRRERPWWTGSVRSGGTATAAGNISSGRASFSGARLLALSLIAAWRRYEAGTLFAGDHLRSPATTASGEPDGE